MQQYVARRLLLAIPTLIGVCMLVFVLMRIIPGDVAILIVGGEEGSSDPEALRMVREQLGLDKPMWEQFGDWFWGVMRFDFGHSLWTKESALSEIAKRFPLTLQLAIMATLLCVITAIPAGVICAIRQDSGLDYFLRVFTIVGLATPSFWLGLLVIIFLVRSFGWVPPLEYASPFTDFGENMAQLIWPTMVVAYREAALVARMTRSCMLEVLREDYIRTAWAKGLRERVVIYRHALKNATIPVVTLIGINFAFLFGGLVVTETVFTLPGLGRYVVNSIFHRDYPMIQAIVLVMAFITVMVNLLVDLLYGWFDPRVRYG